MIVAAVTFQRARPLGRSHAVEQRVGDGQRCDQRILHSQSSRGREQYHVGDLTDRRNRRVRHGDDLGLVSEPLGAALAAISTREDDIP
jgi:hypothetical protein